MLLRMRYSVGISSKVIMVVKRILNVNEIVMGIMICVCKFCLNIIGIKFIKVVNEVRIIVWKCCVLVFIVVLISDKFFLCVWLMKFIIIKLLLIIILESVIML